MIIVKFISRLPLADAAKPSCCPVRAGKDRPILRASLLQECKK